MPFAFFKSSCKLGRGGGFKKGLLGEEMGKTMGDNLAPSLFARFPHNNRVQTSSNSQADPVSIHAIAPTPVPHPSPFHQSPQSPLLQTHD